MWSGWLSALKDSVYWFVTWAASWPLYLLEALWNLLPAATQEQVAPLVELLIVINHWVPVEETIQMATVLFELNLSCFVMKILFKRFLRW